jgi:hypothetical protein
MLAGGGHGQVVSGVAVGFVFLGGCASPAPDGGGRYYISPRWAQQQPRSPRDPFSADAADRKPRPGNDPQPAVLK